jgi:hypothetical protein
VYDNDELEFDCAWVWLAAPQIEATMHTPIARRLLASRERNWQAPAIAKFSTRLISLLAVQRCRFYGRA